MVLYRFYRIVSDKGPEEYIGSTRQPLHKRYCAHKRNYLRGVASCSSKIIFELYGVTNCSIVLISELECPTRMYALREERRIYDERKPLLVNVRRPWVTDTESKEDIKQYYEANKEDITLNNKQYYEANKETITIRRKKYYEANKK